MTQLLGLDTIRAVRATDRPELAAMFGRLSPTSIYRRFLTLYPSVPDRVIERMVSVDHQTRESLVVVAGGEIVGLAEYAAYPSRPGRAEIAVTVDDRWHRRGIGTALAHALRDAAVRNGFDAFMATTLGENLAAAALVRRVFPAATAERDGAIVDWTMSLGVTASTAA